MVIATSTLAFMACQGCVGTMVKDASADAPLTTYAAPTPISDGLRIATSGAFDTGLKPAVTSNSRPETIFLGPEQTGPTLATSVSILTKENMVTPWARDTFTVNSPKVALSGIGWSGNEAVQNFQGSRNAARLLNPVVADRSFNAEFTLGASREETGLAFDLNLVPSVSYQEEGEFETRRVGAEIRLGRDFDQRGTDAVADSWYVFAGTEGEALVWEAGEYGFTNVTSAMALRDQVTVGDLQAGVSIQRGRGQLSLSYIRREVEWRDRNGGASTNENFAGVSFTLRQ
ncbi:MAG: hypothetical protein AAF829_03625 [Pseudomonadota bacterium]